MDSPRDAPSADSQTTTLWQVLGATPWTNSPPPQKNADSTQRQKTTVTNGCEGVIACKNKNPSPHHRVRSFMGREED